MKQDKRLINIRKILNQKDRSHIPGVSLLIGILSGFFVSVFDTVGTNLNTKERFITGLIIGSLIPAIYFWFSLQVLRNSYFRKKPYSYLVGASFVTLMITTLTIHTLVGLISFREQVFSEQALLTSTLISLVIASSTTIFETIRRFSGKSVIIKVLLGKYHQAKTEDIAILFIDLKSSTSLAELLGSDRFFNFLNEFHSLVEDFVRLSGGTIYKYLGDGQIVIWETKHLNDAFKMIMNLSSTLNSLQEGIIKEYHHPMQFTAGLHCGPTLVGEIGFERREIGYWGTTINIAQRIQSACKEHDATFLLSEDVYSKLDRVHQNLPNLKRLQDVKLRGLKSTQNLYRAL